MHRFFLLVTLSLGLVTVARAEDIRIPILVGQTGAAANFGRNETDGYTLAAEERNAQGGINGKRVVLQFEDTQTSAKQIVAAFQLHSAKSTPVILGPTWLDSMPAIIPIAQKKGVLLVTPSAAVETFTAADRNWAVTFYHNSTTEIKVLLDSLRARNLTKIALVYEQEPFSEMIRRLIVSNYPPLVADIGVQAGESDFRGHLGRLRNKEIDAVIVLVWETRSLLSLLQQLRTHLPAIPLATIHDGAGWLEDPTLRATISRLIYSQFVLADTSFKERFKARFGYNPILTASNAYDALHAVMSALAAGANSGATCRHYIMNNQLQTATFGAFRFSSDGSVPSRVEVVEYGTGGARAPQG